MIPGVRSDPPTKVEARAFHESEANCNHCRHLRRVQRPKDPLGFMEGHCGANPFGHLFAMKFHPDDPMHMKCWEPR